MATLAQTLLVWIDHPRTRGPGLLASDCVQIKAERDGWL